MFFSLCRRKNATIKKKNLEKVLGKTRVFLTFPVRPSLRRTELRERKEKRPAEMKAVPLLQ
jgi:hypothetical protein